MEMRFKETADNYLERVNGLQPFSPFPRASDRAAWEHLPDALKKQLITLGEKYLHYEYPAIRATDFMAFKRTGSRVNYEELYFARRYALNSLVLAECTENLGRFLDDIVNGIFALCEESAWQLPAHNSYGQGAQEILPDSTRSVLDLFACETGCQLACVKYLLAEQLDAVSPFIVKRISHELERRIIHPYLTEHFWWMGTSCEAMCNWTPWCTQNVLLTAFLNGCPDDILKAVFLKSAESLDFFLKDYGEDGCCDEGAQYYRHAGLCLDGAADILNQVSHGAFAEVLHWDKIKNMAAYIFNVHVDGKYYFNFADCSPIAGRAGVREYLFGKHTAQPDLMCFAAKDFQAAREDIFSDESHLLNLYYRLQTCFHYEEVMSCDTSAPILHRDIFYPSVGLFLTRNGVFDLAVKAGDNNDSHNHNDTGSITLYKNGQPILVDIGVESYTQKTFSPRRYEIWTMQSGYHNLPTIDGLDQHAGASYKATGLKTLMTEQKTSISMELSTAYPLKNQKLSYVRKVSFDKVQGCIVLTDTIDAGNDVPEVILNFITYEKPKIRVSDIKRPELSGGFIQIGAADVTFTGAQHMITEVLPITDKRLLTAWDHDLYRIRLKMSGCTYEMTIR